MKNRKGLRIPLTVTGIIVCLALCFLTFERTKVWESRGKFWGDVAEKYPRLELPYLNRAIYYVTIDNKEAALADLNKALAIRPDYPEALKQRYFLLIEKGQYQDALNDIKKIIRIEPNNAAAYYMAGEVYGKYLNDNENALLFLQKAYELNPHDFQNLSSLGIVYAMKGDFENAIKFFNLALEIEPNNPTLLSNLSLFYGNIGDTQKAEEFRRKAELVEQ